MRSELVRSLWEIECKLNAVDTTSTNGVEAMQSQLQEAKVANWCTD